MIKTLTIKNFALIDDICVDFNSGLTIITGETGAGKSILLGALALVLGKRADLGNIKDTSKKCVIEADFSIKDYNLQAVFDKNNLDFDVHTIIRRELHPNGKSRAFVNDTPVTLAQLQVLAPHLVDIHDQQDTIALFSETFQIEIVDVLAGNSELLHTYSKLLNDFVAISETITHLNYKKETASKEIDYNTFLLNELEQGDLKNINQNELEDSFETLNNIEAIQETLSNLFHLFSEEQTGILETTKEARNALGKIRNFTSEYEEFWKRIDSSIIELEDIFEGLQHSSLTLEVNPEKLHEVNEKLQTLYKLQQKHSVATVNELLEIQLSLESKIHSTVNLEKQIKTFETEQLSLKRKASKTAKRLHDKRLEVMPSLKEELEVFLKELGLPNAQFKFEMTTSEKFRKNGTDILQLLFTANKGLEFAPIKKVASGGELSRIMLAIKAVLAKYKKLPSLIFDEIDTGVSGEIAYKMAEILNIMSKNMQMLCITHLPQIAAKGENHIKVYKEDINDITVTRLRTLNETERVEEIAEMLGGKQRTETAIIHAKELLN